MTMPTCSKVLLTAPHMDFGGSAKVLRQLARGLSRSRFEVHLALLATDSPGLAAEIEETQLHCLGARRVRNGIPPLVRLARRLKPDVLFSAMAHLNLGLLLARKFIPAKTAIIIRQNSMLSPSLAAGDYSRLEGRLFRRLYSRADYLVCQSPAMAEDMKRALGLRADRIAVLHNPIGRDEIRAAAQRERFEWNGPGPHLASLGRLSGEKGFDLLLLAIAKVRRRFPDLELAIAGLGPLEGELKALSAALSLSGAVRFLGQVQNPYPLLASATALVLPSRRDAMPNALLEAAALGLPIVATPASAGVTSLLAGRPGVWIARQCSSEALSTALLAALESLPRGRRFEHAFLESFQFEPTLVAYEDLFETAIAARRK